MSKKNRKNKVNTEAEVIDVEVIDVDKLLDEEGEPEAQEEPKKVGIFKKAFGKVKHVGVAIKNQAVKAWNIPLVRGTVITVTTLVVGGITYKVVSSRDKASGKETVIETREVPVERVEVADTTPSGSYEDVHGYTPEVPDVEVSEPVEESKPISEWTAEELEHSDRDCNE